MKYDFPSLFPPGFHDICLEDLERLFVEPFEQKDQTRRIYLCERLRAFLSLLTGLGIVWEVWLDGSFCTEKPIPEDVDLIVFASADALNGLSAEQQESLRALFGEARDEVKARYGCDAYYAVAEDVGARSYWRGWFGFNRREHPKGIARVVLRP